MAAIKTTKDQRQKICRTLLNAKFKPLKAALDERRRDFALRVYKDALGKKTLDLMANLPEGFCATDNDIQVKFGDQYTRLSFGQRPTPTPEYPDRCEHIYLPFPANKKGGCVKVYEPDDKLSVLYWQLEDEGTKLRDQREEMETEIMRIINSVTTVNALKELWPEIAPLVDETTARWERMLPAVIHTKELKRLNKALALPPAPSIAQAA